MTMVRGCGQAAISSGSCHGRIGRGAPLSRPHRSVNEGLQPAHSTRPHARDLGRSPRWHWRAHERLPCLDDDCKTQDDVAANLSRRVTANTEHGGML